MCFTLKQLFLFGFLITFRFHIILSCSTNSPFTSLQNVTASMNREDIYPNLIELHWTFACPDQAALVSEYTITYCPVAECNAEMPSETVNPNNSSTVRLILNNYPETALNLENLRSNTTYRIHLASPNLNQTYTVYGRTDLGVPEAVEVLFVLGENHQSPILLWYLVSQFFIDYFYLELYEGPNKLFLWQDELNASTVGCSITPSEDIDCMYTLPPNITFQPYSYYEFTISVCNYARKCSEPFTMPHQTHYDSPSVMLNPILEKLNESAYRARFDTPHTPNGVIAQYIIHQSDYLGNEDNFTFSAEQAPKYVDITVHCEANSTVVRQPFKVAIAAVNIEHLSIPQISGEFKQEDAVYYGNFSEASEIELCYNAAFDLVNSKSILWIILASTLGFLGLLTGLYFLYNGSQHLQAIQRKARSFQIKILSNEEKQENDYSAYPVLPGEAIQMRVVNSSDKLQNNQPNVETLCNANSGYVAPEILLNASKCRKV